MRLLTSHKGDNGSVAIIGGSRHQHGAPLFSALAAEASGVDLLFLFIPAVHEDVAKHASLNLQVHGFGSARSDIWKNADHTRMVEFLATIDAAVIGPGLARTPEAIDAILRLLNEAPCPLVVDASALQPTTLDAIAGKGAVLTPHLGELERMGIAPEDLTALCRSHRCTILLKGREDRIVGDDGTERIVRGGNPGLTVGGTGDALAGLIAGLMAQGMPPAAACERASLSIKRAGDLLLTTHGHAYTTMDVIGTLPILLRDLAHS